MLKTLAFRQVNKKKKGIFIIEYAFLRGQNKIKSPIGFKHPPFLLRISAGVKRTCWLRILQNPTLLGVSI